MFPDAAVVVVLVFFYALVVFHSVLSSLCAMYGTCVVGKSLLLLIY